MLRMSRNPRFTLCLLLTFLLASALFSCATVGRPFPESALERIVIGRTTSAEINELFGPPWRTGLEDGLKTWTYGHYRYSIFAPAQSRDLVIRFDDRDVVVSYSYSATESGK
jgi:hypothetical protein